MSEQVKVFVSYSWGTERETRIVDQLKQLCSQRGINLIRDNNALDHGASIKKFMDELSKGDNVITVFSKAYFESKWCMYELISIYQRGDFAKRTYPVIADDINLDDDNYRLSLVTHWQEKFQALESKTQGFNPANITPEIEKLKVYRNIFHNIADILSFVQDRLNTPLWDLQKNDFAQLLDLIKPQSPISSTSHLLADDIIKTPDQIAAWINRTQQWENHIEDRLDQSDNKHPLAFVVAGVYEEWPASLLLRLTSKLGIKKYTPINPKFNGKYANRMDCGFWYGFLHELMPREELDQLNSLELDEFQKKLESELSHSTSPMLFSWQLNPSLNIHLDLAIIKNLVFRWESLIITKAKHPAILMIIYDCVPRGGFFFNLFKNGERKIERWRSKLQKQLGESDNRPISVTTRLNSPKTEEIIHWLENYHHDLAERQRIHTALSKEIKMGGAPHGLLLTRYLAIKHSLITSTSK